MRNAKRMATNNTIYVAARHLHFDGAPPDVAGAGVFPCDAPALVLTAPGKHRSLWRLPRWFYPSAGRQALSYHRDLGRWQRTATGCSLQTVGRGQEFVLDCEFYPEALGWLAELFASTRSRNSVERRSPQRRPRSAVTRHAFDGPIA